MKSEKMLVASKHNWGLMGPGKWNTVTWVINHDKTYKITVNRNPKCDSEHEGIPKPVRSTLIGEMQDKLFGKLKTLLEIEQWRTPGLEIHACDGVAWKIDFYAKDGTHLRGSGKLGYIYGEKTLQSIISLLPDAEKWYDAAAFVSIKKKD